MQPVETAWNIASTRVQKKDRHVRPLRHDHQPRYDGIDEPPRFGFNKTLAEWMAWPSMAFRSLMYASAAARCVPAIDMALYSDAGVPSARPAKSLRGRE